MKPWPLFLILGLTINGQGVPSALAVSQKDANKALKSTLEKLAPEMEKNTATDAAKAAVDARVGQLEGYANLSNKKAKSVFDAQGANKRIQVESIKADMGKKATWLKKFKTYGGGAIEYGETLVTAGVYISEGDARGAFGAIADTAGKKMSGWIGAAAGAFAGGPAAPVTAVLGSAAGETSWEINPLKKKIADAVDASRDQSYADRLLGYRPSWRSHEASEAKKKRDLEKAKEPPSPDAANAEEALRKQVEGRLISQNLPAPEALVNQLVGIIQSRGQDALEAALKECSAMQGTFEGTLNGRGSLRVSIEGMVVSATFADQNSASAGGITAVATTTGGFTGTFDPVSGNLTFSGPVKTIAVARGIKPTPDIVSVKFTGHFTGQGFKGNAVANGQSLSWTVSR